MSEELTNDVLSGVYERADAMRRQQSLARLATLAGHPGAEGQLLVLLDRIATALEQANKVAALGHALTRRSKK